MVVTTSTSVSLLPAVEAPALVRRSVLLLLVVPVVFVVVWSLKRSLKRVEVDRMGMSLGCLFEVFLVSGRDQFGMGLLHTARVGEMIP